VNWLNYNLRWGTSNLHGGWYFNQTKVGSPGTTFNPYPVVAEIFQLSSLSCKYQPADKISYFFFWPTVDGRNPANQLRLVVYPITCSALYIQTIITWFLPSTRTQPVGHTSHFLYRPYKFLGIITQGFTRFVPPLDFRTSYPLRRSSHRPQTSLGDSKSLWHVGVLRKVWVSSKDCHL